MAERLSREMSGLSIGLCKYLQAAINGEVDRDDALADVEAMCERHGVWRKPGDAGLIDHACKDMCDEWRAFLDDKPEAATKQADLDECRKNLKEATTKQASADVSRLFEEEAELESWLANHDNKRRRFEPE